MMVLNIFTNHSNRPSTSAVLTACGYELPTCIHVEALTFQFLKIQHRSGGDFVSPMALPIPVPYPMIPSGGVRLFARLVNQRWVFIRYSPDFSKFHCLLCHTTGHCSHWYDLSDGKCLPPVDLEQKKQKVAAEIQAHVDANGALRSTGVSQRTYAIYTQFQKFNLVDRQLFILNRVQHALGMHRMIIMVSL